MRSPLPHSVPLQSLSMTISRTLCVFALIMGSLVAQPVTFTGDVAADFPATAVFISDPGGQDVGVPIGFPPGTISGWDMQQCALSYDAISDNLYVGFDTFGISGDADGDGNPDATGAPLMAINGTDFPMWASTESGCVAFDLDDDGQFDVIFGITGNGDVNAPVAADFTGSIFAAGFAFGAPIPGSTPVLTNVPSAAAPDLQFAVPNFSAILNRFLRPGQTQINATFFQGSFGDAGIGEDYVPGTVPASIPITLLCRGVQASVSMLPMTCQSFPGEPQLFVDPPAVGTIANYGITSGQPNTPVWIWASFPPVNPHVDVQTGCTLYLDFANPSNFYILDEGNTDALGSYNATYTVPLDPSIVGTELLLQSRTWFPGGPIPGGDWVTQGARIVFGCP